MIFIKKNKEHFGKYNFYVKITVIFFIPIVIFTALFDYMFF